MQHPKQPQNEGTPKEAMGVFENLLQSDFQQCFEQMRHYDDAFQGALQFAYTGVVAVAGASGTLLQIWHVNPLNLATVSLVLLFSSLAGIVILMLLAKNRVYFARVARYVNEIRHLYLQKDPAGIANKAGMFDDVTFPPILDFGSTQTFQIYLVSAFDSFLFACGIIALVGWRVAANHGEASIKWSWGIWGFAVSMVVELGSIFVYWYLKESETTKSSG
jgi:hypothetical protein